MSGINGGIQPVDIQLRDPAYSRVPAAVGRYVGIAQKEISKLAEQYVRGQDSTLVPWGLVEQLRQEAKGLNINMKQLVRVPNQESLEGVIASVIEQVQREAHPIYLQPVTEALEQLKKESDPNGRKYAATLKEAANALGVELPAQLQ